MARATERQLRWGVQREGHEEHEEGRSNLGKGETMQRGIRDALVSVIAMVALIALLAAIDDRVRERLTGLAPEGILDRITTQSGQLASAGTAVRGVIADHAALAVFVCAASSLVACMLRT
jgi:hypothetical protein